MARCGNCSKWTMFKVLMASTQPLAQLTVSDGQSPLQYTIELFPKQMRGYAPEPKGCIPEEVQKDFEEALQCFDAGFIKGAACVGRRALQAAVREQGAKPGQLRDEIDSLDKLTANKKAEAHVVRLTGNEGAHPEPITKTDCLDLLELTEGILEDLYVTPAKLEARRLRREQQGKS